MNNIIEIDEDNFETEALQGALPVVVDFYAPWCGPCKMLAPLLEQLAREFQGRLKFAKVNVDKVPGLAARFNITGVPTLALFESGQQIDALVGFVPPRALGLWLEHAAAGARQAPTASEL